MSVRTHLLHIAAIRAACERGRELREQAGTLTGDAAGDHDLAALDPAATERLATEVTATIPEAVDAELVHELPEVLVLLADAIGDESGLVPTGELTARIDWETKPFGEALRAAGVLSAGTLRMPGYDNPVSVADIEAIRQAIWGLRPERGRHTRPAPVPAVPTSITGPPTPLICTNTARSDLQRGRPDSPSALRMSLEQGFVPTPRHTAEAGQPERNPMPTINSSREFHPGRWLALVAAACFATYLFG